MAGQLFTSTELDTDGRQVLLDDTVLNVHYYSTVDETWDKAGSAGQSWFLENFLPNDSFDTVSLAIDRWTPLDTSVDSGGTLSQSGGKLVLGVEKDEGLTALSSDGKWRLEGDFDIRLYIDWDSYYNEYRGVTHTYLKVGYDAENAARVALTFDGGSAFAFSSEKTVGYDLKFFDWKDNEAPTELSSISSAQQYDYFKIVRQGGVIQTYVSDGVNDVQIGADITESVFSGDLFVEFGVEAKEYNTVRSGFTKFLVSQGTTTPVKDFFSTVRGTQQRFPDKAVLAVDYQSLSIIDEDESTLWMRFVFGEGSPVSNNDTRVFGCNGVIYCTTSDGLVAFDFHRDQIFKYKGSSILVADEPLTMRNAEVVFRTFAGTGDIQDDNIHDVTCRSIGADDYLAFTNDAGVTVMRALTSGVAYCADGPLPGARAKISEKGALYWSGYDQPNNDGELSFFSNITALSAPGTNPFNRTDYYGPDTDLSVFGANIVAFDVRTVNGADQVAVGTTEGISFVALSPGAPHTKSTSYGVQSPADNPIADPSFEKHLGLDWRSFQVGLHPKFIIARDDSFSTGSSTHSLKLAFKEPSNWFFEEGTIAGVYQDGIDFTGLVRIYFDSKMLGTDGSSAGSNLWDFEILVGDTVAKSYRDIDGAFTKYTDSVDVTPFEGVRRLTFRIRMLGDYGHVNMSQRAVYIDNLRTTIGDPDYRILPAGNASVKEVLLQYDSAGHKVYFSTQEGYGAVDLDDNSLDYFLPVQTYVPEAENVSADFTRVADEV